MGRHREKGKAWTHAHRKATDEHRRWTQGFDAVFEHEQIRSILAVHLEEVSVVLPDLTVELPAVGRFRGGRPTAAWGSGSRRIKAGVGLTVAGSG